MSGALLFAPHHDDETLFAAYLCQTHRPRIVTVLRSVNQEAQGISHHERVLEADDAADVLGCLWEQWPEPDNDPDWSAVEAQMRETREHDDPDRVFAPWPEHGGHDHHNRVGELASEVFGGRVTFYTTYQYGGDRTKGDPVPFTPEMVLVKLRALACYESQILRGPTRFFTHSLDEWTRA